MYVSVYVYDRLEYRDHFKQSRIQVDCGGHYAVIIVVKSIHGNVCMYACI